MENEKNVYQREILTMELKGEMRFGEGASLDNATVAVAVPDLGAVTGLFSGF